MRRIPTILAFAMISLLALSGTVFAANERPHADPVPELNQSAPTCGDIVGTGGNECLEQWVNHWLDISHTTTAAVDKDDHFTINVTNDY